MVLRLSFACWDYDRMKAIEDGRVRVEGIELTFLNYRVEETFFRQLRFQEFDVSELSLSSYVMTLHEDNPKFIAVPVFPSRFFRHQSIYINVNSGIKKPSDLEGKRIGIPEYQMTAAVWQRGLLEEEFGVPLEKVEFFTGAIEPTEEERKSKIPHSLPPGIKVTQISKGQNLSDMLASGTIDCIFSATKPSTFYSSKNVDYLFPNFQEVEVEYFRRTAIFPIMHVVAIKRSVYEANPWIAKALTKGFAKSMEIAYESLEQRAALKYMLPWLESHVNETREMMGGHQRWWRDGFAPNRHILETFLDYHYRQGLSKRRLNPEELFAPNTLEDYVI